MIEPYRYRFAPVSSEIKAYKVLGYVSDLGMTGTQFAYRSMRYYLAPTVVYDSPDPEYWLGDIYKLENIPELKKSNLQIIKEFPNEVFLLKKGAHK